MRTITARLVGLTLVIALTLTLAACAGDKDPVKIGSIMDLTGDLGEFGPNMNDAILLAAKQINEAGGVLDGREIEIITKDGQTSDVVAVDAARALVDVDNVAAIIGPLASGITMAVANAVTVPNEIPEISSSATSPAVTVLDDNGYLFRTAVSDAFQGQILAQLAWDQGFRTASALFINNAYGQGLSEQFKTTFTELGGTVIELVPHESVQPTYASELEKATAGDPDVLVAISYPESASVYLREALESGAADTFLFVDGTKSLDIISAVGDGLEGTYGTAPGAVESPSVQRFDDDFIAEYGRELPLPFIRESYDAMVLLAFAMEKAGSDDGAAIRDALQSVSRAPGVAIGTGLDEIKRGLELLRDGQDINYEGASGPVDLDDNGDVSGAIEIWRIENGEIVQDRVVTE